MRTYTADEINEALAEARDLDADYDYVAVRIHCGSVSVGETLAPSHVWIDGEPTDDCLNGTCGISIDASTDTDYMGDCLVVIAGNDAEWGEDDGEVIIEDAIVLAVL